MALDGADFVDKRIPASSSLLGDPARIPGVMQYVPPLGITAPLFATHYPWLGGLPVHESSRRVVRARSCTPSTADRRVHSDVYSYNARLRSIRRSSGG